ncbi:GNAT family N-acetyltransferase [Amaricoccus macauensis]|uniref:GNAT family N-acetyltransferase n=1 Tax=Amaricoccus macauensis TaxID=57001 RepID=UPI003C7C086E
MSHALDLNATWPPAATASAGGFLIRQGLGGGRRVSSALLQSLDWSVQEAEAAMTGWGQSPCFQIWPEHAALDTELAGKGYAVGDPAILVEAPVRSLALDRCDERTIFCAGPLMALEEIWRDAGSRPAELRIMDRVQLPKIWIMGRAGDRPEGAAFVAVSGSTAMLHALEVRASARRHGLGARITRAAASWAAAQGADTLALAVRASNEPAIALYSGLGFVEIGRYHYRERA